MQLLYSCHYSAAFETEYDFLQSCFLNKLFCDKHYTIRHDLTWIMSTDKTPKPLLNLLGNLTSKPVQTSFMKTSVHQKQDSLQTKMYFLYNALGKNIN